MEYPVVAILSGPERTRAKAELALEKARLTIIPPTEWPIQRESYKAEHWGHLTPWPMSRLPDKDEYVPAPHIDTSIEHGFVAVLAETEALFHAAYGVVEKAGWDLRVHHELPEKPKPDPRVDLFDTLLQRMDAQEQRIADLTRKLGGLPSIGGAGFETGAGEFMQAGSYSAAQLRRSVFAWAARTSANVEGTIIGGLLSATDMQLSNAVSGLVVNTSAGACLIGGTEATSQGGYHGFLSSTNSTTLATANGSNPRIDLLCATSADPQYTLPTGGTSGYATIVAVTGTPTSGATLTNLSGAGSLPGSSLLLGYVLVPAAATNLVSGDIKNVAQPASVGLTNPYKASIQNSGTSQSIGANTLTPVTNLSSINFDTSPGTTITATPNILVAPVNGIYLATGWINYAASGSATLIGECNFLVNGSTYTQPANVAGVAGSPMTAPASALQRLHAGDTLELVGYVATATSILTAGLQLTLT